MYCKERRTGKHDESILSLIFPNDLLSPSPISLILFICCPLLSNSVILFSLLSSSYPILSYAILLCYSPMLSYPILSELPLFRLISPLLSSILSSSLLSYLHLSSPLLSSPLLSSPLLYSTLVYFSWPPYS